MDALRNGECQADRFGFYTATDPYGAPSWAAFEDALLRCLRWFDAYADAGCLVRYGSQLQTGVDILMIATCYFMLGRYQDCIDYSARFGWTGQTSDRIDDVIRLARERLEAAQ